MYTDYTNLLEISCCIAVNSQHERSCTDETRRDENNMIMYLGDGAESEANNTAT
jgi:hypothetical protein